MVRVFIICINLFCKGELFPHVKYISSCLVFATLQSPGGQGLFSPTGGLNSYSGANTPRGSPIKLEAGGDVGINTPKIPANQQSMINISPLASKQSAAAAAEAGHHSMGAPDTPGSINFSEVFADSPVKKDGGASALLQLAEHATPGGGGGSRPIQFMSPLLANSLRRATSEGEHNVDEQETYVYRDFSTLPVPENM